MGNPFRGEAPLPAGAETFTLVYDVNALVLAEEETGLGLKAMLEALDKPLRVKLIRAMVWAGLQARHACNLLRAGEIVGEAGIVEAHAAVTAAIAAAFPKPVKDEGDAANPRPAAGGTG